MHGPPIPVLLCIVEYFCFSYRYVHYRPLEYVADCHTAPQYRSRGRLWSCECSRRIAILGKESKKTRGIIIPHAYIFSLFLKRKAKLNRCGSLRRYASVLAAHRLTTMVGHWWGGSPSVTSASHLSSIFSLKSPSPLSPSYRRRFQFYHYRDGKNHLPSELFSL